MIRIEITTPIDAEEKAMLNKLFVFEGKNTTTALKSEPKYIKIKGRGKEIILQCVINNYGLTNDQIVAETGYSANFINVKLRELIRDGKVERSANQPYIYYEKGNNQDLKESLKNAKKTTVIG